MSAPTTTTPVLIIGAGPSGMVTALCLALRGVDSILVERQDKIEPHPKAHELSARSIEILHELGIDDAAYIGGQAIVEEGRRVGVPDLDHQRLVVRSPDPVIYIFWREAELGEDEGGARIHLDHATK